jgi:uncharacterized membrane protein YraQ (UPF0718 family)
MVLGRFHLERYVEDFVWKIPAAAGAVDESPSFPVRINRAAISTREIVGKVWPFVLVGIGVGAAIHGYVPADSLAGIIGGKTWWSVPVAVLVGIPLYSNAAGIIPVVGALMEKGATLGTVLAFMMSVTGLSLPEMIILRRVLKLRLIIVYVAVIAVAIVFTGYLFNILL